MFVPSLCTEVVFAWPRLKSRPHFKHRGCFLFENRHTSVRPATMLGTQSLRGLVQPYPFVGMVQLCGTGGVLVPQVIDSRALYVPRGGESMREVAESIVGGRSALLAISRSYRVGAARVAEGPRLGRDASKG